MSRWLKRALVLALALTGGFVGLGLYPIPPDFAGDDATAGAGVARNGLERPLPAMPAPADNRPDHPQFAARADLGRLLFFDPVLSGENAISCATCHHPDLGFSDGRGTSMGRGGKGLAAARAGGAEIRRAAPSIWNAAYNHRQFWDGRAENLEEQAKGPIQSKDEMDQDPAALVRELAAIPEYVRLFEGAFGPPPPGGEPVTFDRVAQAIGAFERTLTANRAPFDRFAAGERDALTTAQRRGFELFRSGKTRCFECHGWPTFANPDFKVVGVPDLDPAKPDLGRAEIAGGDGYKHAFKVATLRNVALSAPYMHNGSLKSLEQVLDFYARGGGHGSGMALPNIDDKIRPFKLSVEERSDLIAFLHALTDESNLPAFPERVPSGLPVVPRLENHARHAVVATSRPARPLADAAAAPRAPTTHRVRAGESIQAAALRAGPGDTIEVEPGDYHETVTIDVDGVTLRGLKAGGAAPARATLDGRGVLADGVLATGNGFRIEGLAIRRYTGNGVAVSGARGVAMIDLEVDDTGLYGLYPVQCSGVTVERARVSGARDAAIYVGQSRDIVVRQCEAHHSVTGIEIENSLNALVEDNYVHDNTGGILVFVLPNNPSKVGRGCKIVNNRVLDNNADNFGDPAAIVSKVPRGTGIMIMAADETEVTANEIRGNDSFGVAVVSLDIVFPRGTAFDVGPIPERTWIHGNRYSGNGRKPAQMLVKDGLPGADLLWDGSGWSNRWSEPGATRGTPILVAAWPEVARKATWRGFALLRSALGM